eukprot:12413873-Karenia_brevis.AAC.1
MKCTVTREQHGYQAVSEDLVESKEVAKCQVQLVPGQLSVSVWQYACSLQQFAEKVRPLAKARHVAIGRKDNGVEYG